MASVEYPLVTWLRFWMPHRRLHKAALSRHCTLLHSCLVLSPPLLKCFSGQAVSQTEPHLSNDAMNSIEAHPSEQIESRLTHHEGRDVEHADIDQAEAEQHMQRDVNQWYANDEEDDVQSGTRKAEEQMRSADEVVGEVHDDIPAGQIQQHRDEEKEDGIDNGDTVGGPTDTTIDMFPGGPVEPAADSG